MPHTPTQKHFLETWTRWSPFLGTFILQSQVSLSATMERAVLKQHRPSETDYAYGYLKRLLFACEIAGWGVWERPRIPADSSFL